MASGGVDEDVEYESDPEEAKLSLTMRRRVASDDEREEAEEDDDLGGREIPPRRVDLRVAIESDGESDGQGAAAEYEDDDEKGSEINEEEEEDEEYEDDEYEEREGEEGAGGAEEAVSEAVAEAVGAVAELPAEDEREGERAKSVGGSMEEVEGEGVNQGGEEEKKQNEPFAVPTAGAFYMHDDRFRDSSGGGGGRNRYSH